MSRLNATSVFGAILYLIQATNIDRRFPFSGTFLRIPPTERTLQIIDKHVFESADLLFFYRAENIVQHSFLERSLVQCVQSIPYLFFFLIHDGLETGELFLLILFLRIFLNTF